MKTVTYETGHGATEGRICFMEPVAAVELAPEKDETLEEAAWHVAPANDGFAQNTTSWD